MDAQGVRGDGFLRRMGLVWFLVALVGQAAFIVYTFGFYGPRTFTGEWERWNDAQLITGFVEGQLLWNIVFASHVILAGVITAGGVVQLIPWLRRNAGWFHRWNGRVFIVVAYVMALGGMAATWWRGSYLSPISGINVALNGALILVCATMAMRLAMARQFEAHERWAMRTFMVVNGVWFFRLGLMAWVLINQGPRGMNDTLSGPADIALQFSSYLVPLLVLELYQAAKRSSSSAAKTLASGLMVVATLVTAIGVFGAVSFMWWPRLMMPFP